MFDQFGADRMQSVSIQSRERNYTVLLRAQGESIDVYISVSDVIDHERGDSGGPVRRLLIALQ